MILKWGKDLVSWPRWKSSSLSRVNEQLRESPAIKKTLASLVLRIWEHISKLAYWAPVASNRLLPVLSSLLYLWSDGRIRMPWSFCSSLNAADTSQSNPNFNFAQLCILERLLKKQKAINTYYTLCNMKHTTKRPCACPNIYEISPS